MKMAAQDVERLTKGLANAKRIAILLTLDRKNPLTIDQIQAQVPMHYKTLNMHIQRLYHGELVNKEYKGQLINIYITKRAKKILTFLRKLE